MIDLFVAIALAIGILAAIIALFNVDPAGTNIFAIYKEGKLELESKELESLRTQNKQLTEKLKALESQSPFDG